MAEPTTPPLAPVNLERANPAPLNVNATTPLPAGTAWDEAKAKQKREDSTSFGDYAGSIWRQDGLVDGLLGHIVGSQMTPDEKYNPFADPQMAELEKGVWPEYRKHLYGAHSGAHALFIQDRLLRKQEDQVRLGDMGLAGNVGRFALNAVMPETWLMGMGAGLVAKGVKVAGTAAKVGTGLGFGAAENAAYESVRQRMNFEDDSLQVVEAGLMGAAFTSPFVLAGARANRRVAQAAATELDAIRAMKAAEAGEQLTPEQASIVRNVNEVHTTLRDLEAGTITPEQAEARMDRFVGPDKDPEEAFPTEDLPEAPKGFLAGSVGAGQVGRVGKLYDERTALAGARLDFYARLNGSKVEGVRKWAFKLLKDPIQNDKFEAQSMTASEWKKDIQRTVGGEFHRTANLALDEAIEVAQVPIHRRSAFTTEFYSDVARLVRGDDSVVQARPELKGALEKAAGAQRKVYADMLQQMKDAGVKGAEDLQPNDLYVNRVWHHGNITAAAIEHSDDAIVNLLAGSIRNKADIVDRYRKSPGKAALTDADILTRKARSFLRTLRELEFSPALRDVQLAGRDMGTLRRELTDLGVKPSQVDDLVDLMFEVQPSASPDAGRPANLKYRFQLDEKARVTTPKGELRLSDLFENDSRVLVDLYTGSMAGRIGLAKHGIDSDGAWTRAMKEAADEVAGDLKVNADTVKDDMRLMQDAYNSIVGRPMSTADFSKTARGAAAFRGYVRGVMLPQLGIAAAFEMNKAVAMMGMRAFLTQLPSFSSFFHAIRKGYIPDEGLARDIMTMTGFGNEKVSSYARDGELSEGFWGKALTGVERGSNKVSHAVDTLSGNASFTSLTKQLAGMMATQRMVDFAHGWKKVDGKDWSGLQRKDSERMVGHGVNHDDIQPMLDALKQHTEVEGRKVVHIDYEGWLRADPKTYQSFRTYLTRSVRDAIQDHDLGETMPFMHSTLGKMFAELKTFFLVGHAKNFLKQGYYHDGTMLQVWAIGFLAESMAYMTQTAINFPGDTDRLSPDRIAKAAFFRMSAAGTASFLTETGYNIVSGGDSLVQPGMTANTGNRSFLNTPSLIVAKRLIGAPSTATGMLNPWATTTRQEVRDLWGTVPGANLYGAKAAGNWLAETFPKSEPGVMPGR